MSNTRKVLEYRTSKKGVTYPVYEKLGKVSKLPSLTIPNQSIPLQELITRYRRDGTEVLKGVYSGDSDLLPSDFERLDKMQRIDFMRKNAERIVSTRNILEGRNKDAKTASAKAAFEAAVNAKLQELKASEAKPDEQSAKVEGKKNPI